MTMNVYLNTLENDIDTIQGLSGICRGEWCRFLESEVDALQTELTEFKIKESDFESERLEEMSFKIRDAYRHLAPDVHI